MRNPPETQYAKCGDLSIAYQVVGDAPLDLVVVPGIISHVEFFHELPGYSRFVERLAAFARVITFDKRGTGLSDRIPDAPTYEDRMDDIAAVMRATGCQRAALFGISEGGSLSAQFAATYPERVSALILFGAFARISWAPDYPIGVQPETFEQAQGWEQWGTGVSLGMMSASRADDAAVRLLWAKAERLAASPGGIQALLRLLADVDVRSVLPSVRAPTLVLHPEGDIFPQPIAHYLADHIPGARWVELKGVDHYPWFGPIDELVAEVQEFLTGNRCDTVADPVLATIMFTDIVGSTERAAALGDRRWRELLESHHRLVRKELARFRGREIHTAGDGFLAAFDGPARAVRCACAIRDAVRLLGIEIRAGLHTGECELIGEDIGGIAVHIGARVATLAGASEVLVSSTVKDLVAGSGLRFAERGVHALKGVPGEWRLYAVAQAAAAAEATRAAPGPGAPGATLRREGDYWTLVYAGVTGRVKDMKGLRYLVHLLGHPGHEFHVLDLIGDATSTAPAEGALRGAVRASGPLLDAAAKAAYRRRLEELREDAAEAERFNDGGRTERARTEMDALTEQLAAAVGLGGRDRPTGSEAERARTTVTHNLRTVIERIARQNPRLGDHLTTRVRTGTFCMYAPDPERPIDWTLGG